MRQLLFFASLLLASGFTIKEKMGTHSSALDGVWTPIQEEIAGQQLPTAAFQKQKLTIADTTYTFQAESLDKGTLRYQEGQMDIYGKEGVNKGRHFTAIYKLEGDHLTICYNLKGDRYPSGFETKSMSALFLCVFQKEQAQ